MCRRKPLYFFKTKTMAFLSLLICVNRGFRASVIPNAEFCCEPNEGDAAYRIACLFKVCLKNLNEAAVYCLFLMLNIVRRACLIPVVVLKVRNFDRG